MYNQHTKGRPGNESCEDAHYREGILFLFFFTAGPILISFLTMYHEKKFTYGSLLTSRC